MCAMQGRETLRALRKAIKDGNGHVVGGRFTYADIAMVFAVAAVDPIGEPYMSRGP